MLKRAAMTIKSLCIRESQLDRTLRLPLRDCIVVMTKSSIRKQHTRCPAWPELRVVTRVIDHNLGAPSVYTSSEQARADYVLVNSFDVRAVWMVQVGSACACQV